MAWAMTGQQKRAKEVSEICVNVCVCAVPQKEAKQPAMGQGPIDEIDFWFFWMQRGEGGDFPAFLPPSNSLVQ